MKSWNLWDNVEHLQILVYRKKLKTMHHYWHSSITHIKLYLTIQKIKTISGIWKPFKIIRNVFYFTLKALFVRKSRCNYFGNAGKQLHKEAKINSKIYDVINCKKNKNNTIRILGKGNLVFCCAGPTDPTLFSNQNNNNTHFTYKLLLFLQSIFLI